MTKNEAIDYCTTINASLIDIQSQAEYDMLIDLIWGFIQDETELMK